MAIADYFTHNKQLLVILDTHIIYYIRVTRRVSLVEQEQRTLPKHRTSSSISSEVRDTQSDA